MLSRVHRIAMNLKEHSLDFKPVALQQPELFDTARVTTRAFQILKKSYFKTLRSFGRVSHLGDWEIAENYLNPTLLNRKGSRIGFSAPIHRLFIIFSKNYALILHIFKISWGGQVGPWGGHCPPCPPKLTRLR